MDSRNAKKCEVLFIDDINSARNQLLSDKSNHYIRLMMFNLRLLFRYNDENLEEFIEFYYYLEDILNNEILLDFEELKIFIYRVSDLIINIEDYEIHGVTLITECSANLLHSLYLELETYHLVDKTDESEEWKNILMNQIKNQVSEFDILVDILNSTNEKDTRERIYQILLNNYPLEFATYKARKNILD